VDEVPAGSTVTGAASSLLSAAESLRRRQLTGILGGLPVVGGLTGPLGDLPLVGGLTGGGRRSIPEVEGLVKDVPEGSTVAGLADTVLGTADNV
jgi:hypothetical protein